LPATVNKLLAPLNVISTPSITAWVPTAEGTYGLPLGGSVGYLVTMPTLDIGPVLLLATTDTVVAAPIAAAGVTLPADLATFGAIGTPGLVLPTATGVDTIGGVSLSSFSIPSPKPGARRQHSGQEDRRRSAEDDREGQGQGRLGGALVREP
jgi:hypothetical protein